ncbi:putative E3 ubiquitin-protein ligase HIP1 [Iris pallida]|uniref:RING-type E3 ubiquitin transferase n=1 Tax=Iris pallida TaxID=29817 RepID=A0AAX6GGS5_IRIPA|nr:putative E3 ubiquitin-protein ligase HIP1 [Iris pallida]
MDRGIWNHPDPDPQLNLVNGSFMLHTDIATVGGGNPMPYFDITLRSNNLPSSNLSVEIQNHMAANPGLSHNPYLHASSASSSDQMPPDFVQTGPSCYNSFANGHTSIAGNPQMEYGRASYKRKNPAISTGSDRGNTNVYYSAGSSSNCPIPSSSSQPNSASGPQYWSWDPASMPLGHRSSNPSNFIEGTHRNVRSRQSHALSLENNQTGSHYSSNLSHNRPSTNPSGLAAAGQWSYAHAAGQWSHAPVFLDSQRSVTSSGSAGFNHAVNQPLAGSSNANQNMEIGAVYPPNPIHNGSSSTQLPTVMSSQGTGVAHNGYGHSTTPYNVTSSYQPMGFAATLEDGRWLGMEAIPRRSRPLSIVGRSNERNGRSRTHRERYQPFSHGNSARSRWVSEGVSLMDRSTIYDTRNSYDQHRDLRLDIDHMSYEELLALEETIGSVSTGLSENTISVCLMESAYCSSDGYPEDENCIICLEEYKHKERLGKLKCGHNFHASCIKKWLLIKNVCPICKGAALTDPSKER